MRVMVISVFPDLPARASPFKLPQMHHYCLQTTPTLASALMLYEDSNTPEGVVALNNQWLL